MSCGANKWSPLVTTSHKWPPTEAAIFCKRQGTCSWHFGTSLMADSIVYDSSQVNEKALYHPLVYNWSCLSSPLPFCNSPVTRPSPGGLPSWSFHFQSIPRTTLLPTLRCFSIWERISRRWRRKAASTSLAALPGHRDQQGFNDLASLSAAVTPLEEDCSGPGE